MNSVDELNLLLGIGPARPQLPVTLRKSGYLPVRALGKGSYGQALLVFHEPRQKYFVVKHLNLAGMTSRQRRDAHNEISILQKLHHPNIVQYVEYYEEHPNLYIVMEYADGGDVYSLLSSAQAARRAGARAYRGLGNNIPSSAAAHNATSGLLSEAQVVSLFVQTTMAVRYMHDQRLLHRDIKSSNIFLTKNHIVKLGDFGISTVLQSTVAMASTMCGTPCYFSPELCQGRPYNSKSDMWALGVLLYELCAGHVPFESTTMKTLMRDIVHKQPPRIPALYSDALWELIMQLLQKDPRRRPDAGQVLMSPALMKYVPELIEQLASDPAYAAAAKDHAKSSRSSSAVAEASPPASPPPPPRRLPEQGGVAPGVVGAAAAFNSSSPSALSSDAKEKSATPRAPLRPEPSARPLAGGHIDNGKSAPAASPEPSTASIAALLARFDAQKQQLSESKLKKQERAQRAHDGSGSGGGGNALPGVQDRQAKPQNKPLPELPRVPKREEAPGGGGAAVAGLSPGAAAALRQQGMDAETITADSGGAVHKDIRHAKDVAGHRRSFAPPPLPAALRDSTALRPAKVEERRESMPPTVPVTAKDELGRNSGCQRESPTAHSGGSPSSSSAAAAAAAALSGPTDGAQELGAVLTELSTWRERSLRRQRRQHDGDPTLSVVESSRAKEGVRDGAHHAPMASPPPPQSSSSASEQTSCGGRGAPAGVVGAQSRATPTPPSPSANVSNTTTQQGQSGGPDVAASAAPGSEAPPVPPSPSSQPHASDRDRATTRAQPTPPDSKGGGTSLSLSPSLPAGSPRSGGLCSLHHGDDSNSNPTSAAAVTYGDDDQLNSDAQSFVDVMGTTLDVQALQQQAPITNTAGAAAVVRHGSQQGMHKSFRGTSKRVSTMRASLKAGSLVMHSGAALRKRSEQASSRASAAPTSTVSGAAAEEGEEGEEEVTADMLFETSCLCGRATTNCGCLSLIYGSFICTCSVCQRFSGAAQGVEWLHLPEVEGLQGLLRERNTSEGKGGDKTSAAHLSPSPPSSPSNHRPSAGGGAVAAAAIRAQAVHTPYSPTAASPVGQSSKSTPLFLPSSPSSSPDEALRNAGIRTYKHQQRMSLSAAVSEDPAVRQEPTEVDVTEIYAIYTCATCGGMMGMQHDGVPGLLLPKVSLNEQSLQILSSCAQTVDLEGDGDG
jgi:serine/threonine protein kinase